MGSTRKLRIPVRYEIFLHLQSELKQDMFCIRFASFAAKRLYKSFVASIFFLFLGSETNPEGLFYRVLLFFVSLIIRDEKHPFAFALFFTFLFETM